ncbi:MAG: hypothetical protein MJK04_10415, partial [Psychrosphaera sp.]|nr:hypothetical protein [Psychrosphaera sp.]
LMLTSDVPWNRPKSVRGATGIPLLQKKGELTCKLLLLLRVEFTLQPTVTKGLVDSYRFEKCVGSSPVFNKQKF